MEQGSIKCQIPTDHLEFQEPMQELPVETAMPIIIVIPPW